jgi:hypothetical protein
MPLVPAATLARFVVGGQLESKPATTLETWLVDQVAYANWEMERVRVNAATAPEPELNALYNRASRNWNRARKELEKIQTNRLRHITRLSPGRQQLAAAAPLGDPSQPARAKVMPKRLVEMVVEGTVPPEVFNILTKQEAR